MFNWLTFERIVLIPIKRASFTGLFFAVLFLAVFLGDGRQAFVDVFLSAGLLLVFVAAQRRNKSKRPLPTPLVILWSVLIVYLAIRTLFSFTPWLSVYQLVRWTAAFLVFRLFFGRSDADSPNRFFAGLRVFAVTVAILSFAAAASPFIRNALPPVNLLYSSFGHNHSVDVLFFTLPAAFWAWIDKKDLLHNAELGILALGVLFSLSRAGIVLMAAVFYIGAVAASAKARSLKLAPFLVLGAVVVIAVWMIVSTERGNPPQIVSAGIKAPLLIDARREYWRQALVAFHERPLFGFGPGSFSILSGMFQRAPGAAVWYSHNFILGMLAETGLVGLLLWSILIAYIFVSTLRWSFGKSEGNHTTAALLVYGAGATLVLTNFDYVFEHYVVWLLFWATLGTAVSPAFSGSNTMKTRLGERVLTLISYTAVVVFYTVTFSGVVLKAAGASPQIIFLTTPFSLDAAQRVLIEGQRSRSLPVSIISMVSLFHRNNPDVQLELAKYYESAKDQEKSTKAYLHTISLNPRMLSYHQAYVSFLLQNGRYEDVANWLNQFIRLYIPAELVVSEDFPQAPADTVMKNQGAFQDLFDEYFNTELRIGKLYYLLGAGLVARDAELTRKYWEFANRLLPDLSYIYIERASLQRYVFGRSDEASRILSECAGNAWAAADCSRFSADSLPAPGSQLQRIRSFPVIQPHS